MLVERGRASLRARSPNVKHALRTLYHLPYDLTHRADLIPPRRLHFVGDGPFVETGEEFFGHFVELGGLERTDAVLDVGCGVGRMALPLTRYIEPPGSYDGIDVVPYGIRWCQRHLTPRFPHFRFHLADIQNSMYNPKGLVPASRYRFPFDDASFDFAMLNSVFTHMLPDDVRNYVGELGRVLVPGGRCFATFFLLNDESRRLLEQGASSRDFRGGQGPYRTIDPRTPEAAVAYDEAFVRELLDEHGFEIASGPHYGSWSGRPDNLTGHDIVVATKR